MKTIYYKDALEIFKKLKDKYQFEGDEGIFNIKIKINTIRVLRYQKLKLKNENILSFDWYDNNKNIVIPRNSFKKLVYDNNSFKIYCNKEMDFEYVEAKLNISLIGKMKQISNLKINDYIAFKWFNGKKNIIMIDKIEFILDNKYLVHFLYDNILEFEYVKCKDILAIRNIKGKHKINNCYGKYDILDFEDKLIKENFKINNQSGYLHFLLNKLQILNTLKNNSVNWTLDYYYEIAKKYENNILQLEKRIKEYPFDFI